MAKHFLTHVKRGSFAVGSNLPMIKYHLREFLKVLQRMNEADT